MTRHPAKRYLAKLSLCAAVAALGAAGCRGGADAPAGRPGGGGAADGGAGDGAATTMFVTAATPSYAGKVKNLLTGLPLTDDELKAVSANAGALPGLIDTWIERPEWRTKMLEFFKQAFQQTQTNLADYDEQLGRQTGPWNNVDKARFLRSAEESFARTALQLIAEGKPFTEVVTTDRFMLNPPLMSSYAFIDAFPQGDNLRPVAAGLWLLRKFPGLAFVRTRNLDATGQPVPIPIEQSIDPRPDNPNFMKWFEPMPYMGMNADRCGEPQTRMGAQALFHIADFLYGGRPGCGSTQSQWRAEDWDAWRMVTIRAPRAGEERTIFWDVPRLRDPGTAELLVATPRVGFLTTLAFFANWPTNPSNSYRVTANQALIVGLGRSFDDRGTTVQLNETSVDDMHVQPNTTCFGCHQTLDPMRDFFRQTYSLPYSAQLANPAQAGIPPSGTFAVDGAPAVAGHGVGAFAKALADHPRFATAWIQKLCHFANSGPCPDTDPELARLEGVFRGSKHNFKTLVRELFSSPLVTFASKPKIVTEGGPAVGIARRETLCAALERRLDLPGLCEPRLPGQMAPPGGLRNGPANTARNLAQSIPGGGYARGDETPLLPHDPNLFFVSATENLCALLAAQLVSAAATSRYRSARRDEAISDFVATVMGLPPSDPRSVEMRRILDEHHGEAVRAGVTPTEALRSTFTLACSSPLAVSVGL